MRNFGSAGLALALAAGLSACGSPSEPPAGEVATAETSLAAAPTDARPASFSQCSSCHAVQAGSNGIGPSLAGVFGAKAGHLGVAYKYSDALLASGLTWDEAALDEWLTMPSKKVPGTKMVYAGMADPAKRKELIEYLKTLE